MSARGARMNPFTAALLVWEGAMVILYATCTRFDYTASGKTQVIAAADVQAMQASANTYASFEDIQARCDFLRAWPGVPR